MILGFAAYGISLALFVVGLRHLGTARTGAYFSIAPFIGAALAVGLGEPITLPLIVAGCLMGAGIWLHLREHHDHEHAHDALDHSHEHEHDEHHQHTHPYPVLPGTTHTHRHVHLAMNHTHPHFPDVHHRHKH